MLRLLVLVALAASLAIPAQAQFTISGPDTSRVLTVSGFGRASSPTDRAILRIAFETEGETIEEAIEKHESEVERVRSLLLASGVDADDIKLERAAAGPSGGGMQFDSVRPGSEDQGFSASRVLVVGVNDLSSVPRLMAEVVRNEDDDLLDIQRRNVDVRYTIRDPQELEDEALQDAVSRARQRAELIASMANVTLGDVIALNEGGSTVFGMEAMAMAMMRDGMGGAGLTDGEFVVNSSVVMTFRIR